MALDAMDGHNITVAALALGITREAGEKASEMVHNLTEIA
jgi:hypothetical protein